MLWAAGHSKVTAAAAVHLAGVADGEQRLAREQQVRQRLRVRPAPIAQMSEALHAVSARSTSSATSRVLRVQGSGARLCSTVGGVSTISARGAGGAISGGSSLGTRRCRQAPSDLGAPFSSGAPSSARGLPARDVRIGDPGGPSSALGPPSGGRGCCPAGGCAAGLARGLHVVPCRKTPSRNSKERLVRPPCLRMQACPSGVCRQGMPRMHNMSTACAENL